MSKTLIYLFAIFALWLYFKYGNFKKKGLEKYDTGNSARA